MCLGDLPQTTQNTFLLEPHLAKKNQKEETKLQNPETQTIKSFSTPRYTEKTGLQHCETPAPNLPTRCRQV
jgi:hypothetical protein